MVRGLIEQQNVGRSQQQTGKAETILLAAREFLGLQRPHFTIETESLENRFSSRGVFKTTFVLKLLLQIAVTLENFFEIVAGFGHAMLELVHLVFDLLQTTECSER